MRQIVFAAVAALVVGVSGPALALNPQPLPPGRQHADFNPQPDPPGRYHHTVTHRLPPGPCKNASPRDPHTGLATGRRVYACAHH